MLPAYQAAQTNIARLQPQVDAVGSYYSGQLAQPLTGNPYLTDILDKNNRDVTNSVSSHFEGAGRYGSGNFAGVLGSALSDSGNALRYQDYTAAQARQDAAARGLLGVTSVSAALPQAAAGAYADQIRALLGGYGTSTGSGTGTSTQSGNIFGGLLGLGGAALGGWASGGFKT